MGGGTFNHTTYRAFTSSTKGKTREEVFTSRIINPNLNPYGVKVRESRDSPDNPQSTAIIVGIDVTGSMGILADKLAREGLGTLFTRLLDDRPVTDPHVMFMAIGDANCDSAPLQVSQFEADNRVVEQLTQIYIEGGGGGNTSESYHFPWYFAARHTSIDCFEKRGKKGYLFTAGDEETPPGLTAEQIKRFIGDAGEGSLSAETLLAEARKMYHCYHIIIEEGNYARGRSAEAREAWSKLMGENALSLHDYTKLADGIVAVIEMNERSMGHGASTKPVELPGYVALLS